MIPENIKETMNRIQVNDYGLSDYDLVLWQMDWQAISNFIKEQDDELTHYQNALARHVD